MFKRIVLYFIRDNVYHILASTNDSRAICGYKWDGRARRYANPYYGVKVGPWFFEQDGEKVLRYDLCPDCASRLAETPKIPAIPVSDWQ